MLKIKPSAITPFLKEVESHLRTERAIHHALELRGRRYYAQFPAPLELYIMTRILRPLHIIESGVSSGMSSAHFLMALKKNGKGQLHSIDLPQYQKGEKKSKGELSWSIPKGKNSGWAVPNRLKKNWDLRQGKTEDLLPSQVKQVGRIDVFCHGSPWTPKHLAFELEAIEPGLHPSSLIVADNTGWNPGAVARFARKFSAKVWQRRGSDLIGMRIP